MRKHLHFVVYAAGVSVFVSLIQFARPAYASSGSRLALDLDYTHGIDEPGVSSGTGLALRYGYKLDLMVFSLTPELGGSYAMFNGPADVEYYRGFAGGRLTFGKVLEPGIFAHIGYGHVSAEPSGSRSALSVDGGATLDLTIIPVLDLGAHVAYSALLAKDNLPAFDTYILGLHAALAF
jgi:hypothetical protein